MLWNFAYRDKSHCVQEQRATSLEKGNFGKWCFLCRYCFIPLFDAFYHWVLIEITIIDSIMRDWLSVMERENYSKKDKRPCYCNTVLTLKLQICMAWSTSVVTRAGLLFAHSSDMHRLGGWLEPMIWSCHRISNFGQSGSCWLVHQSWDTSFSWLCWIHGTILSN